jgi:2'-5' RNA ligase
MMKAKGTAMQILHLDRLAVARLTEQAANLTEAEAHAANDLALYTVNTSALYHAFKPQMQHMAAQTKAGRPVSHRPWVAHVTAGRRAYQSELKADALHAVASWRQEAVLSAAALQVADHYAEEMAEMLRP